MRESSLNYSPRKRTFCDEIENVGYCAYGQEK